MQYVTDGRRKFVWLSRPDVEQDLGECISLIDDSDRWDEIAQWRGYAVHELAKRECGWVRDGALVAPPDEASGPPDEPLVSPYRDMRWQG